jgi:hypothetical protein
LAIFKSNFTYGFNGFEEACGPKAWRLQFVLLMKTMNKSTKMGLFVLIATVSSSRQKTGRSGSKESGAQTVTGRESS